LYAQSLADTPQRAALLKEAAALADGRFGDILPPYFYAAAADLS
jgi:hypothetical protein